MMNNLTKVLWLALIVAGTISCNKDKKSDNFMPPITGKPGEITLVMTDALYDGPAGDTLYGILCIEEPALPQSGMEGAEPMFDVIQVPPTGFGNIFRANRNIIIVSINDTLEKAAMRIDRSYWAKQQLLIRMTMLILILILILTLMMMLT